jgi:hypothetical protein
MGMGSDAVVGTDFSAAHPAKERLGIVGAGLAIRIALGMIDALGRVILMQQVPRRTFIGVDRTRLP